MFKKYIKYDIKAVFPIWGILAICTLALSIPVGLATRITNGTWASIIFALLYMLMMFSVMALLAAPMILSHYRYYRSCFTDEGYLTFTLPVKRQTIYLAKLANTLLWACCSFVVIVVALLIVACFVPDYSGGVTDLAVHDTFFPSIKTIFTALGEAFQAHGAFVLLWIVEGIGILFGMELISALAIDLCITWGGTSAKKHKVLLIIGILYIGYNFALPFLMILPLIGVSMIAVALEEAFGTALMGLGGQIFTSLLLLLIIAIFATVAYMLFTLIVNKLEHKLNLS